ncbi:hypothetical protein M9H77_23680 [Catharanthus roseus]|uniref:Uncharacterized protein n=1 Tax=Catharanthus roseus TaxID=4058 RepID=A0ACC0AV84_CATRO|nr:hypothetical protein M9H77_23680 [Catharanthus roseus]
MAVELTSLGSLLDLKKIELPKPCQPLRLTVLNQVWGPIAKFACCQLHTRLVQHGYLIGAYLIVALPGKLPPGLTNRVEGFIVTLEWNCEDGILLTLVVLKSYFAFAAPAPELKRKIIFWLTGRRRKGESIG